MPLPNFHACRLKEPGQFDTFRRGTRTTDGKTYSVIFGRSGSASMQEQAYRYSKKSWTASEAGAHCRAHKGRFEAAVSESMLIVGSDAGILMGEWIEKVNKLIEQGYAESTARAMARRIVYGEDE